MTTFDKDAFDARNQRLRSVTNFLPVVIWEFDTQGIITLSEGKALASLGFKPGELVGQSVFDLYKERPDFMEHSRRALTGDEFTVLEVGNRSRYLTAVARLGLRPLEWAADHELKEQARLLAAEL